LDKLLEHDIAVQAQELANKDALISTIRKLNIDELLKLLGFK